MAPYDDDCFRNVDYLRISITDRCNQRCIYCMPQGHLQRFEHSAILRYEEILTIAGAAVRLGFRKFRLTGGEPLVRRGVCQFVRDLAALPGVDEVVLTTNGVLLEQMAPALYAAGLRRLNISLDTLNPLKFRKITQRDHFQLVLRGIARAREAGFDPIKINTVVIRGMNDDELEAMANWAEQEALAVRFIEYMPIGCRHRWDEAKFVSIDEIRGRLERIAPLHLLRSGAFDGPAVRYRLGDGPAEIGLIGAVSHHFCHTCNRLRLTSEGKLRACLLRDEEIDIKAPLRQGCDEAALMERIQQAVDAKIHHRTAEGLFKSPAQRAMSRIGG